MPNSYTAMDPHTGMKDLNINPDTMMIVAGLVISFIAVLEIYPAWKQARNDRHRPPVRGDGQSVLKE